MITVLDPGLLCTIQDLGRPGVAHLGVPCAGAACPPALQWANRLVGEPDTAAGLEFLLGGFRVRFEDATRFALAGAPVEMSLDGRPVPMDTSIRAEAGSVLTARRSRHGLRTYLGAAGGIAVPTVLGSRSTDTLSGLGPAPVTAGTSLPLGVPTNRVRPDHMLPPPDLDERADGGQIDAEFVWGPRETWITDEACALLVTATWRVSTQADRIAARLDGPALTHRAQRELPSEGLPLGAIQVPPSGQPIIHLANHPPTGGYPVVGVVRRRDVWRIGDARPGTPLRLRAVEAPYLG